MPVEGIQGQSNGYSGSLSNKKLEQTVTADDFLQLMIAQLKNQDFMNPVDDTQYVSQLAQFTSMQYMQQLTESSEQSYVLSLVGQNVTAARFKVNGEIESVTGAIEKVSLLDNEYVLYVGGKAFTLDQIMELHAPVIIQKPPETDYTGSGFLLSLMGKEVTIDDGESQITGIVEKISMSDGLKFMIDGEWYTLDQIATIDPGSRPEKPEDGEEEEGDIPPVDETEPESIADPS